VSVAAINAPTGSKESKGPLVVLAFLGIAWFLVIVGTYNNAYSRAWLSAGAVVWLLSITILYRRWRTGQPRLGRWALASIPVSLLGPLASRCFMKAPTSAASA
jgi:hypothetical protein